MLVHEDIRGHFTPAVLEIIKLGSLLVYQPLWYAIAYALNIAMKRFLFKLLLFA